MFNNSLDRPFPKLGHSLKVFPHVFSCVYAKAHGTFYKQLRIFLGYAKKFLIGVHDQKCLETVSLVITKVEECLLFQE